ncbi:hypothetical protein ETAA8_60290 [Anatilimnocola aggregata]|uniref:Uncharacterized protein n=1 Tax=Anatilimnocola aggregata TaxID=2528021 RepID=A0A517YKZ6_9BACT|nr:hypothetical protein [Anatilimnocola aggregata]QDU30880.1 hypothetical protein ETAA8_60290 [Anatilimnocola aggregata]
MPVHHFRIVCEDVAKARQVEVLVDYTVLGGLVQVGAIRPTKVTLYDVATNKIARELPVWTSTGRRLLRRSFLKNRSGFVALQHEIQSHFEQREALTAV